MKQAQQRYAVRYVVPGAVQEWQHLHHRYHCLGCPADPKSFENAHLMTKKSLEAYIASPTHRRLIKHAHATYEVIAVACTFNEII